MGCVLYVHAQLNGGSVEVRGHCRWCLIVRHFSKTPIYSKSGKEAISFSFSLNVLFNACTQSENIDSKIKMEGSLFPAPVCLAKTTRVSSSSSSLPKKKIKIRYNTHTHRDTFTMGQSVRLGGQQQQELCLSWHARDENRGGGGIEGRDSKLSSKDWPMYGSWLQFTVHGIVSLHWSRFQGECEFLPLRGPVSFYSHCRSVKNRALVHVQETRTITSEKAKRERKNTTISSCFTRKLRPFF